MTEIDDIRESKEAAIAILDELIVDATRNRNDAESSAAAARWAGVQRQLERQRNELDHQAYERDLDETRRALEAFAALDEGLANIVVQMHSATGFCNALAELGDAVNAALGALKRH